MSIISLVHPSAAISSRAKIAVTALDFLYQAI